MNSKMDFVLQAKQITKRFDLLVANDHMNILYGLWQADEGEIFVKGEKVRLDSPRDAMARRIGMVSQHFSLITSLTVTQNVVLGKIPSKHLLFFDRISAKKKVEKLAETLGFKIEPDSKVEDLSVGEQQRVEILKAIYHDAEIIILDEPTAVLTPQEASELFQILRMMTEEGRSVVFITHKLREAIKSDRATVLRNGQVVLAKHTKDTTEEELAAAMFGNTISHERGRTAISKGQPVLEIKDLWTSGDAASSLKGLSLTISEGEIFGIAGVAGNGQDTLASVIMGVHPSVKGRLFMRGVDITNKSPNFCRGLKIGYIPEKRKTSGLLPGMSVAENLILGREGVYPFAPHAFLDHMAIRKFANEMIRYFDIKTAGVDAVVQHLSGGNLQKVILAREFASEPALIIASQPVRGLDAKTEEFVHRKLEQEREKGKAILLISYDLDEILELSDPIGVLYDGKLEMVPTKDLSRIGRMMVGIREGRHGLTKKDSGPN
jgi:simple sugar transport system ATP-binding protein